MSSPGPTTSSKGLSFEVHILACGHGDTILLRLPGPGRDTWVLVDCYLPKKDGTRARFFEFVESRGIVRLDYVILTHPDYDHFHGMAEVLDYFSSNGRSVGYFAEAGLNAHHVSDLLRDAPGERAYARLQRRLDELHDLKAIEIGELNDEVRTISPKGLRGCVDLIPVAPSAGRKRRITRRDVRKLAWNTATRFDTNPLSIVLVLAVKDDAGCSNVLLAADADKDGIENALTVWGERAVESERTPEFDMVKVPHHGSTESHVPRLYKVRRSGDHPRVTCISAGTRPGLPSADVMRYCLDNQWTVLLTTKRKVRDPLARGNRAIDVANRAERLVPDTVEEYDLCITWSAARGLEWSPSDAELHRGELHVYGAGE